MLSSGWPLGKRPATAQHINSVHLEPGRGGVTEAIRRRNMARRRMARGQAKWVKVKVE